jgi:hypothetical protein
MKSHRRSVGGESEKSRKQGEKLPKVNPQATKGKASGLMGQV